MIIFHEGLPRSGKSYEACVYQIIPALQKGRQVFAYIEGLNHQQFSDLLGIPLAQIQGQRKEYIYNSELNELIPDEHKDKVVYNGAGQWIHVEYIGLLHQIHISQVKYIYKYVANDSLVIIDELQDFFPSGQRKLPEDITSFVTQHGHRGLDIICMGQDHRDCHNLWKRRIDQLFSFTKMDAIGKVNRYLWKSFKQKEGRFVALNSGTKTYDPKYYGLYKSFTDGTLNKDTKVDDRTNVLNSPLIKIGVPAAFVVALIAVGYLYNFFHGGVDVVKTEPKLEQSPSVQTQSSKSVVAVAPSSSSEKATVPKSLSKEQYMDVIMMQYKPRLAALLFNEKRIAAQIEFVDDSLHVKESLNLVQIAALGWQYTKTAYGLLLVKGKQNIVVTAWPMDAPGKVSNDVRQSL